MLKEGDRAPDFEVPAEDGEPVRLSDFRGQNVVLYFFPKANTPGWTTEAGEFRRDIAEFEDRNTEVLGISPDPPETQEGFKEKQDLPFHLLSDEDRKVAETYGVLKEKNGKMGIERSTFLIGEDGRIRKIWTKVKPEGHSTEVLAAIGGGAGKSAG